jgi:hypothetical protein
LVAGEPRKGRKIINSKITAIRRLALCVPQSTKGSSHYGFLLIIEVMASSPLLQPALNVRRFVVDKGGRYSGFRAQICADISAMISSKLYVAKPNGANSVIDLRLSRLGWPVA